MNYVKKLLIAILLLWVVSLYFLVRNPGSSSNSSSRDGAYDDSSMNENDDGDLRRRLDQAERKLRFLEEENLKAQIIIEQLKVDAKESINGLKTPSDRSQNRNNDEIVGAEMSAYKNLFEYPTALSENYRRKIYEDVKDLFYYLNSKNVLNDDSKGVVKHRINVILAEMYNYSTIDYLGEWRSNEMKSLMKRVQAEFVKNQNPSDCSKSKQILCSFNKGCGFGCQMHHVFFINLRCHCFIMAYFTNRTLVLDSTNWRYNTEGYQAYFEPIGSCKIANSAASVWSREALENNAEVIMLPIIDSISYRPSYMPLAVPGKYFPKLDRLHGDPFVWWAGQVLHYLMRFNNKFSQTIDLAAKRLKFRMPCVGVHVRRTDKIGSEASFHALDEYMVEVERFFEIYELMNEKSKSTTKYVYLASDDVSVLKEAQRKFTNYTFIFDESVAQSASVNTRYSPESAQGVILDVHFLSRCEFLVCTFSSQVCRLAYELMQVRYPDASWRFRSLDDVYYFGGQNGHNQRAILDHAANPENGEIELRVGDIIGLAGNHWNGFSKGRNHRTKKVGLFPTYKVIDIRTHD